MKKKTLWSGLCGPCISTVELCCVLPSPNQQCTMEAQSGYRYALYLLTVLINEADHLREQNEGVFF